MTIILAGVPFHIEIEFIIIYLILSLYTGLALIYDEFKDGKIITKSTIAKNIMRGFIPGYNVIVPFFWTIFKVILIFIPSNNKKHNLQECRENYVFGFLHYKEISIEELDDYIESRNILKKMVDKIQ